MKKKFKNVVIFEEKGRRVVRGTGRNVPEKVRDIKEMLEDTVSKFGYRTAFMYKENGKIVEKTFAQFGRDVNNLGTALIDMDLKPAVVNVLIDYVLRINNKKLTRAYVETIASQWKRLGIETAKEAMEQAEKEYKKHKRITPKEKVKKEEIKKEKKVKKKKKDNQ